MSWTMEACRKALDKDANAKAIEHSQAEERKKYLLNKVERRSITKPETYELADILSEDTTIRNSDEGIRTLIMLGLGVLGGYALAKMFQPEPSCQR
ncbi:hypothetical protein KKE26_10115 [bacterium]|nr:hypothetical protein [bacterium]MBU1753045.1 hypothetical protein [bacterium]